MTRGQWSERGQGREGLKRDGWGRDGNGTRRAKQMNVIVCCWLNEGLCHQHSQRAGRGTIDYRMSSRSPQVAKFKTGNGVSRTEIHRGSREATASRGKGAPATRRGPMGAVLQVRFTGYWVPWSLKIEIEMRVSSRCFGIGLVQWSVTLSICFSIFHFSQG